MTEETGKAKWPYISSYLQAVNEFSPALTHSPQWPWKMLIFLLFATTLLWFAPIVWLTLIVIHFALYLGHTVLQWVGLSRPTEASPPLPLRRRQHLPFISIHVPAHNEPPEVLKQTLDALAKVNYPHFEVIVLDNNTPFFKDWKPVEQHCKQLGKRFQFYHFDNVKGYKAGALNISRNLSHPSTEWIAVVDADYIVEPDFINRALPYFHEPRVSHVQFPQAYYNCCSKNLGLRDEYAHYFELILPTAHRWGAPLLTGTMCFVRAQALDQVGGWGTSSITEDAELGLKFIMNGYQGKYAPEVAGRGLMPEDFRSLRKQRQRWIFGNAQSLFSFFKQPWSSLKPLQIMGILLQLTAWFNFLLLPFITLIIVSQILFFKVTPVITLIFWVCLIHFLVYLILAPLKFTLIRGRLDPDSPRRPLRACFVHFGLVLEGAVAWFECLMGQKLGFLRTNKFRSKNQWRELIPHLIISGLMLESLFLLLLRERWVPAASLSLIFILIPMVLQTRAETS